MFGFQSHYSSNLVFRVSFLIRLPELLFFQFDVQSHHHHFSVSAFRAITVFSVSAFRAITVFSVSAFRAIIGFQINIQSHHHHFSAPAFRVIITFRFRRSEPSPCFQFRRSEPSSVFRSTFRVASSVSAFRAIIASQFWHS